MRLTSIQTLLVSFAGAAAVTACASLAMKKTTTDQDVIRMPHAVHAKAEVECNACHSAIRKSKNLEGRQLPKEKTCLKCHAEWKDENQCNKCHVTKAPETWPARVRTVNFSHADHLERLNGECTSCHTKLPEPGTTERFTPPMQVCLNCHNHQQEYNQGRCQPCHTDLTRVPLRPVSYFKHEGNFVKEHMLPARTEPGTCAQCHEQHFCADCHSKNPAINVEWRLPERVDRQFIHRPDYVSRHQMEASADPAMCYRCHGQSFCQECHARIGLTSRSADPRNPHPAGWNLPSSGQFHGPAARRDINSCASCHDQGASSNCVSCHRVGGIGGNPHPDSFLRSHDRDDIRKSRTCAVCHN